MNKLEKNIYVIGSPEVDTMIKKDLPPLIEAKNRYNIRFNNYGIFLYHPVTTQKRTDIIHQCKILFIFLKK